MYNEKAFNTWLAYIDAKKPCILATVLQKDTPKSDYEPKRMFISKDMMSIGSLGNTSVEQQVIEVARKKFNEKSASSETKIFSLEDGKEIHVFIDLFMPPIQVMIFGAGHDAIPVAKYSNALGLQTTVVDARPAFNSEENFPGTNRIIARENELEEKVMIDERTYVVVMNHHIKKDQDTLKFVLKSDASYVGVLGPRSRRVRMLEELQDEGVTFTEKELQKMHSPIGLDIGASTPEEIAISILGEIIAIRNGHTGGFLTGEEYIHRDSKERKEKENNMNIS